MCLFEKLTTNKPYALCEKYLRLVTQETTSPSLSMKIKKLEVQNIIIYILGGNKSSLICRLD